MKEFQLSILAAGKLFYQGSCVSLVVPTITGKQGIMANFCNTIGAIVAGTLEFEYIDGGGNHVREVAAVSQGIAKVENNTVLVLVDSIERPEEIDANRAMRSMQEAKEAMLTKMSIRSYYDAQTKMARALNRLKIKRNYKK